MMSDDHIVYLFVPEALDRRRAAFLMGDFKMADRYSAVLDYVRTKINIDIYNIDEIDFLQSPARIVPTPDEIINQKPTRGIPNN